METSQRSRILQRLEIPVDAWRFGHSKRNAAPKGGLIQSWLQI
jgi:hypothetical protein